jgi:hypothetical protein
VRVLSEFLPQRGRGTAPPLSWGVVEGREAIAERGTTAPCGRGPSVASRHLPRGGRNIMGEALE